MNERPSRFERNNNNSSNGSETRTGAGVLFADDRKTFSFPYAPARSTVSRTAFTNIEGNQRIRVVIVSNGFYDRRGDYDRNARAGLLRYYSFARSFGVFVPSNGVAQIPPGWTSEGSDELRGRRKSLTLPTV